MKVLLVSGGFLPMAPSGPAYITGAARMAGHEVEIFDGYVAGETDRKLSVNWRSGAVKPLGITKDFCKLMKDSGCSYAGLSIETASGKIRIE